MSLAIAIATYAPPPVLAETSGLAVVNVIESSGLPALHITSGEMLRIKAKVSRQAVEKLRSLGANWDGEGATAPSSEHIDLLLAAMDRLPPDLPSYSPMVGSDGEVGIYWSKNNDHAEIAVDSDGELTLYLRDLSVAKGQVIVLNTADDLNAERIYMLRERISRA
jgi:hypothetical protein